MGKIQLTVDCHDQPDRIYDYNANNGAFDFKWDRRCGDGNLAPSGSYTVVLEACDIYKNCDEARGKVDIPFVSAIPPADTPVPTKESVEEVLQWYSTPTAIPSSTPTPRTPVLPVLPMTGNQIAPDNEIPSGNNQPLLPLAATALGTSVLLAASSRKEEETPTETPVKVSSLSALAGIVKTGFDVIWNEAVRISAADAPREISRRTYYVGVEDPQEALRRQQELAAMAAAQPAKTTTSTGGTGGKVAKTTQPTSSYSYQDLLYGNGKTKGVMGTSMGYTSHGQTKSVSVSNSKSTSSSKPSAAKTSSVSTTKTTSSSSGGVLGWISNTAKSVVNSVKSSVTSTVNKVVNTVTSFVKDPVTTIKNVVSSVKNTVTSAVSSVANTVKNTASAVNNAVTTFVSNPIATIKNVVSAVQTTVHNVATNVKSTVTNTVNKVVNKVNTTTTNVVNTVSAAGVIASAVAEDIEEKAKESVAEFLNDQIDDLGTLHDTVGKQAEKYIVDKLNYQAWLWGSLTDSSVNPYLTEASTVGVPAFFNGIKDGFGAWGGVYEMMGIIRNYTFDAFTEGRWDDGVRGLVGIAQGNLAMATTPVMAAEIIAEGIINLPAHTAKTGSQFFISLKDLFEGKRNYGDVAYTGLTFAADVLTLGTIINPGAILESSATRGVSIETEAVAARALAMAEESGVAAAEGTVVKIAEIAAETGSKAAVVEGMEASAVRAAEGTVGETDTLAEAVLNSTDDVIKGGGELSEAEIIAQKQAIADAAAKNYNSRYSSPTERVMAKGYDGVRTTPNGGPTFQGSDWMYPVEEGQSNVVKIKATGDRPHDFEIANEVSGIGTKPPDATWHHLDDLNVETGEITLELVDHSAHRATLPHSGSAAQYDAIHGPSYNK